MMVNYFYDGTFEGLLTLVYKAYYRHEVPSRISSTESIQQSFLDTNVHIKTDEEKSSKVYKSIREKISYQALKNVYHAYLSEIYDIETHIYQYIRLGFKEGKNVDLHLSDDRVLAVHTAARKVMHEQHLMLGMLRFKQLENNVYYAKYTPDHNITTLISNHFVRRFSDQNWIIHDLKRKYAAVYDRSNCIFIDLDEEFQRGIFNNGDNYEELWKDYFNNICIKERINPKLQRRNMPARYWKHLTEKQM